MLAETHRSVRSCRAGIPIVLARRLRAAERAMVRAEASCRRIAAELAGGVPVYAPELAMAE